MCSKIMQLAQKAGRPATSTKRRKKLANCVKCECKQTCNQHQLIAGIALTDQDTLPTDLQSSVN